MTIYATLAPGIYSPVPTFFQDNEIQSIDLEEQKKQAKILYDAGISGVLVGGSTGEAVSLSLEERCSIIKTIRDSIPDKSFQIIAGGVGSCIPDLCKQAFEYKISGADSMIVLVPGYYGSSIVKQEGLIDWFCSLADKCDLPIVVYNYPGVQNGIDLNIESFIKIGLHDNIIGCKLTNFNFPLYTLLGQSKLLKENNFTPLSGVGQVLVPALSIGVNGAIDGISNVFPKCMVKIQTLYNEGKYGEAAKLQELITTINEMTAATNLLGLKKALNFKYGLGSSIIGRPPLNHKMDMTIWKKYLPVFNNLSEIEDSL